MFNDDAREQLRIGVNTLADAVKVTMGPKGRFVLIDKGNSLHITKDGVSVAREVILDNPIQNMGAQLVKEVASKTADEIGDGPQPLYSKVLTPNGWTTMGELKIGDLVCGTNQTIQQVIGVFPKGIKEIYKLKFSNGQEVECCEDHLWSITTNYNSKKIVTTKQMFEDPRLKYEDKENYKSYKYYINTTLVDFNKKDHILDPYLVGLLIGDGSCGDVGSKSASIELSLALDQDYILNDIILPENIQYKITRDEVKHYLRVKFSRIVHKGPTMMDYLKEVGLFGTKSGTKFIPKEYLYSDYNSRMRLLKGLEETDGHINKRGLLEYSTISKQLCEDVVELLRGLGKQVCFRLKQRTGDSFSNTPIYVINELKGYKNGVKLIDIEKTNTYTEMQCIKVSNPDHLYITNDYILTHNTTSATVLAQAIVNEGLKEVKGGANVMDLKKGIDLATAHIVKKLNECAIPIKDNLVDVATISANNDLEMGKLIADTIKKVSYDGVITIESAKGIETSVKILDGLQIESGYLSPYFVTDEANMKAILDECYVIIIDNKSANIKDVLPELEEVSKQNKSVLIIANDIDNDSLSTLTLNKMNGLLKVAVIKSPNFGEHRNDILGDLQVILKSKQTQKYVTVGYCDKVIVTRTNTTFIGGKGDVTERVTLIREQLLNPNFEYKKDFNSQRLAKLAGGVAVIYVGAASEVEMKEKKDRFDDALHATRAAIEEGIIPGGGVAYIRSINSLEKLKGENEDEETGIQIVRRALEEPLRQIVENAGLEGSVVVNKVKELKGDNGFNARTEVYEDLRHAGVIDPTKVARVALENAASIASMILTTECVLSEIKEEMPQMPAAPGMGGMGGMY